MSWIFWDTNLFIYLLEDKGDRRNFSFNLAAVDITVFFEQSVNAPFLQAEFLL